MIRSKVLASVVFGAALSLPAPALADAFVTPYIGWSFGPCWCAWLHPGALAPRSSRSSSSPGRS